MNLNDFVVLPNKPKSVKLNARNLRELRMETVQLAQESTAMESRLKQLRESMSREKQERERSGGFHWKSGQVGAHAAPSARRNQENAAPKVPGAKLKVRVLRDEPLAEPRQPVERPAVPDRGEQATSRRPRLKGRVCGQCEVRAAGLMCAECGEDYCIGCFARFHQKGALKLHRMIPIQAVVQTSVSTLDVVRRFQRQTGPEASENASAPAGGRKKEPTPRTFVGEREPAVNHRGPLRTESEEEEEQEDEDEEEEWDEGPPSGVAGGSSLLRGHFDEEESARSFQQALQQWRKEAGGGAATQQEVQPLRPHSAAPPVSVEATGTQADLQLRTPQPIRVEFRQQGLCYMEKLLIKKHRRTPIEGYRPLYSEAFSQKPPTPSSTETDGGSHSLTEKEKELRQYLASLFAVPPPGGSREPHCPTGPTVSIVELDQTVGDAAGTSGFGVERHQANTKSDEFEESLSERRRKSEERKDVGAPSSTSSSSPQLSSSREPLSTSRGLSSTPSDERPTASPAPDQRQAHSPAASQLSPEPAPVPPAASRHRLPRSARGRGSCSPRSDSMKTSPKEAGGASISVSKEPPLRTSTPRSRLAPSPRGVGSSQASLTPHPSPRRPSQPQSPHPPPPASPSHSPSPGSRASLQPSRPASTPETSPPSAESTPRPSSRDSTPPQTSSLLTPDIPSTPPSATHSIPSDSGSEEEKEDWRSSSGLLLDQSDSSDEEIRGCAGGGDTLSPSPSPVSDWDRHPPCPPSMADWDRHPPCPPSMADLDRHPLCHPSMAARDRHPSSAPALFTQPSPALQVLAQRQPIHTHSFLGLEGFLTLGVDMSLERPGAGSVPTHAHTPQLHGPQETPPAYSGGQLSWRPGSSLRESAAEELVTAVLQCHTPRNTHSRPATQSDTHSLHSAGRSTPRPAPERPVYRPLSRAAQEILEVQNVEEEVPCDPEEEEEEDRQALASLEEEFRQMSAHSARQRVTPPPVGGGPGVGRGPTAARGSGARAEGHPSAGRSGCMPRRL